MTPPTVPMPDDDGQAETEPASESTEAGKVSTVDGKGPKTCAADEPAADAEDSANRLTD